MFKAYLLLSARQAPEVAYAFSTAIAVSPTPFETQLDLERLNAN